MPAVVLIGAQWGDEGKGRATDLLGSRVDFVVKFNGGNNAGHTVVIGDEKYALHLLPSGILTPGVIPVIANGVVVDIEVLFEEIDALSVRGIDVSRLRISANAHVITHYHRTMDKVTERFLGKRQIGTTGRGIGPAYADKINRVGIRIQDLFDENILRQKVQGALDQKNHMLVKIYNRRAITVDEIVDNLLSYAERLRPIDPVDGIRTGSARCRPRRSWSLLESSPMPKIRMKSGNREKGFTWPRNRRGGLIRRSKVRKLPPSRNPSGIANKAATPKPLADRNKLTPICGYTSPDLNISYRIRPTTDGGAINVSMMPPSLGSSSHTTKNSTMESLSVW